MGALLMGAARWVIGGVLKWGTIGSVAGGVGSTVISGQDLNATNIARNTASTAKDIAGAAGDFVSEIIAPTPAPTTNGSTQPGTSGSGPSAQNPGASAGTQAASAISDLFNNFSDTRIGQALQPMMGFLKSSPIISGILTLVFGMMALSGQNSWPMRILSGGIAAALASSTGIFDIQGSGRNAPSPGAIGGADSYNPYITAPRQSHEGGPVSGGRNPAYDDAGPDPMDPGPGYSYQPQ